MSKEMTGQKGKILTSLRHRNAVVRIYNEKMNADVMDFEEIEGNQLVQYLMEIEFSFLVLPLMAKDRLSGMSIQQIANKYRLGYSKVRRRLRRLELCK